MRCVILCLLFSSNVIFLYAQSNPYTGAVKYDSSYIPGTITILSTGFGKKKPESIAGSFKKAFSTLLFQGIPGSVYEIPLIMNEREKENPVLTALLNGGYSSFVMESIIVSEDKKVMKNDGMAGIEVLNRITINYEALKRYLQQKSVIRKFGF